MWWLVFPVALAAFLAVLLIRAAAYRPKKLPDCPMLEAEVDGDHAVFALGELIKCRTESFYDKSLESTAEFDRFREKLAALYPLVHEKCPHEIIGERGMLFKLKGKSDAAPSIFMAHYDVVPARDADWEQPPFEANIIDGVMWGRGTLDTKGTLVGVMEGAETLLRTGFVPENDMYFAFGGDEETFGACAKAIVAELARRGIAPAFVLDEGGAVTSNVFPGVTQPCALIGTAEKGHVNAVYTAETAGGHSSMPPKVTAISLLADAVKAQDKHPFPRRLKEPVLTMLDILGRNSTFLYRLIFANLWCFAGLFDLICKSAGGALNAMLRTTAVFTMMQGSDAPNIMPAKATMLANVRLMPGDTVDSALEYLKKAAPAGVTVSEGEGTQEASGVSNIETAGYEKLSVAIRQTWPDALVSPYLMMGGSDSTHYTAISDNVYRFCPMILDEEERGLIHSPNERVPVDKIVLCAQFYRRMIGVM